MNTKATCSINLDTRKSKKNEKFPVKIRITYMRESKYYSTAIDLSKDDFNRIISAKRRSDADKETYKRLQSFEAKAIDIIDKLPVFTFALFEKLYIQNRGASEQVSKAFDDYIAELKSQKSINTADSYKCAKVSLQKFRENLRFIDITKTFLNQYENWMYENGNSPTTVGIYLRNLRSIFNIVVENGEIDKILYPFKKGKYEIPTGRNIKKALTLDEIGLIYNYRAKRGSSEEMARDYWIFMYLCNGLNVKDLCLLEYQNIDSEWKFIEYGRAKTKHTKKDGEKIRVAIKPDTLAIIKRWGQKAITRDTFIFPHLQKGLTAARERQLINLLIRVINNNMKKIAKNLDINKNVTTYFARHSFATILKRSGASTEFISDALGHSNLSTTKNYLAGFEDETLQNVTDALTAFKR
jgi:integrase